MTCVVLAASARLIPNLVPHFRTFFLWFHRAIGLFLAIYAVLMGVTGAALVFRDELEQWEHSEVHAPASGPVTVSAAGALERVRQAHPTWRVLSVNFPHPETPYWMVYLLKGQEAKQVYVSPATGEIVAAVDPKAGIAGGLADLHFNLWAGRTGRLVNGWGAILLTLLCLSGLLLWMPRSRQNLRRQVRARLAIPSGGGRRFSWQLHHLSGAIAWAFLVVLAVSGAYFAWPQPFTQFAQRYLGRNPAPSVPAHPATADLLPMDDLARRAEAALPGLPIQRIQAVSGPKQAVRVTMREGTTAEFHRVSTVFLDPVTGNVLAINRLRERPAGDSFISYLSAVHFGVFGGWPVRLLWFALAFGLPVLAWTGFRLWRLRGSDRGQRLARRARSRANRSHSTG